jgi:hypothetical protein
MTQSVLHPLPDLFQASQPGRLHHGSAIVSQFLRNLAVGISLLKKQQHLLASFPDLFQAFQDRPLGIPMDQLLDHGSSLIRQLT